MERTERTISATAAEVMNNGLQDQLRAFKLVFGVPAAFLLIVSVSLLPIAPSVSVLVAYAALLLLAVRNGFRYQRMSGLWRTPFPWMAALFLLHVLGMAWSINTGFGLFDLQIKLPLLALPLLAFFMDRSKWRGRDVLLFVFTISSALMVVACTVAAIVRIGMGSALSPMQEVFSSYWSLALHPSYFALYLSLAISAWCLLPIHRWLPNVLSVVVLAVLCFGVVLSASKIGWMLLVLLMVALTVLKWRDNAMRNVLLGMAAFSVLGVALLVTASPYARDRVGEMLRAATDETHDASTVTSSEVRWLTWGTAWELFLRDPIKGTGTGDIKDELVKAYEANGYTGAAEKRLNAHEQYLQTAACLGLLGVLLVLGIFVVPLFAERARDPLLILFLLLNAMNWLVESMLEVQAGAVFFSLFSVLLLWKDDAPELRHP
ncbi:MAG: O-antigen ligase family protein [Flavobacteriales bacterium]|nr:O-antigen ligase family protein [Flavobacteriales bacterium]